MSPPPPAIAGIVHVVDDDRAFRTAMERLLSAAGHKPRLYDSASSFLVADDSEGPACVLLDLRMPGPDGLSLQATLIKREAAHPIIFLSGHGDIPSTVRAMQNGAVDFLTKPVPTAALLDAIHRALLRDLERHEHLAHVNELKDRYGTLTPRERQVMAGVVAGGLNKQICFALNAAERTIKTHRSRVMSKMKARSVAELVRLSEDLQASGITLEVVAWD